MSILHENLIVLIDELTILYTLFYFFVLKTIPPSSKSFLVHSSQPIIQIFLQHIGPRNRAQYNRSIGDSCLPTIPHFLSIPLVPLLAMPYISVQQLILPTDIPCY